MRSKRIRHIQEILLNKAKNTLVMSVGLLWLSCVSAQDIKSSSINSRTFSLHLGGTRVVYFLGSSGATLSVINEQDYPMLVQTRVYTENMKEKGDFIVTPPLYRLDGKQSSRLKIIRTGGLFPEDRESLQWLCVKGIAPKEDDKWLGNKTADRLSLLLNLSVDSCIKLLIRPSAVTGHPEDVADKIEWYRIGNKLKGVNNTPFHMSFSELRIDNSNIREAHYIPPFSSYIYDAPGGGSKQGKIEWKVLTDYGGASRKFSYIIK